MARSLHAADTTMSAQMGTLGSIPDGIVPGISAELLLQEMRSDVELLILDVRDRDDVSACGAIDGARWVPMHQLGPRLEELEDHRSTPVVIVSQMGVGSRMAFVMLAVAGFTEVMALEGGMERWLELGYPVESRHSQPPSRP